MKIFLKYLPIYREVLAKPPPEALSLIEHLEDVVDTAVSFARYVGLDPKIARLGAIYPDIGKASGVFQERLKTKVYDPPFRHEIASLFFLPLLDKIYWNPVIEMVIAHHKSVEKISVGTPESARGLIDLENGRKNNFKTHIEGFSDW